MDVKVAGCHSFPDGHQGQSQVFPQFTQRSDRAVSGSKGVRSGSDRGQTESGMAIKVAANRSLMLVTMFGLESNATAQQPQC